MAVKSGVVEGEQDSVPAYCHRICVWGGEAKHEQCLGSLCKGAEHPRTLQVWGSLGIG